MAHFGGKVTDEGHQQFVDAVEECLKGAEQVNLVLVLPDVKFYADQNPGRDLLGLRVGEGISHPGVWRGHRGQRYAASSVAAGVSGVVADGMPAAVHLMKGHPGKQQTSR